MTGKIYSKKSKKFMTPYLNKSKKILKDGTIKIRKYRRVDLRKNKIPKKYYIHRLLALHFINNPDNKPIVDHIDGNTINNNLYNLRWVNESENGKNTKAKGYTIYKDKYCKKNPYKLKWYLQNGKTKSKFFKTKVEAQTFADVYEFPCAKNYNIQF